MAAYLQSNAPYAKPTAGWRKVFRRTNGLIHVADASIKGADGEFHPHDPRKALMIILTNDSRIYPIPDCVSAPAEAG